MRHTMSALLSLLLVVADCQSVRAESPGWRLWPFGAKEEPPPVVAAPSTTAPRFTPSPGLSPSSEITPVSPDLPLPHADMPKAATARAAAPLYASPEQAPPTQFPPTNQDADRPPLVESPFAKMKWPTMTMPSWPLSNSGDSQPLASQPPVDRPPPNSWVEKRPDPPKPSPMQSMKNGAHRVAQSTRNAWHKTVAAITPGQADRQTGSRIASRDVKPPFWKRMMGAEEPKPREEQTISDFVGQPRP